jgi:uncharacterized pyridoxal phosphate-containing UPF0001 family protein
MRMNERVTEPIESAQLSVGHILDSVPSDVTVVAAAKGRALPEVMAVIQAGITHIGHNYVQEARLMVPALTGKVTWHDRSSSTQQGQEGRAVIRCN